MTEATKPEIVKVQRAIFSENERALVYKKNNSHTTLMELPSSVLRTLRFRYKAFFYAKWDGENWHIGDEAPWQEW